MSPANTWTPCFEGATIRNLYPGRAGLQGILAVHLLDCGFTPDQGRAGGRLRHDPRRRVRPGGGRRGPRATTTASPSSASSATTSSSTRAATTTIRRSTRCTALLRGRGVRARRRRGHHGHVDPVRDAHGRCRAGQHARGEVLDPVRGGGGGRARHDTFVDAFDDDARDDERIEALARRVTVRGDDVDGDPGATASPRASRSRCATAARSPARRASRTATPSIRPIAASGSRSSRRWPSRSSAPTRVEKSSRRSTGSRR